METVVDALTVYAGRRLCLTTRHGKQRALARPFAAGLGLQLDVCPCDTDQLGTFSGEIARQGDALQTCRNKALLGLEATGLRLGLASEASFGPHPAAAMLAVGHELLLFIDRDRQLEVVEQRLELATNYRQITLAAGDEPCDWLAQVGFPRHAVIARSCGGDVLCKGLRSPAALEQALQRCRAAAPEGRVLLETDMRAHLNPTRMASIRRLGFALVRRLRTACPAWEAFCCVRPTASCSSGILAARASAARARARRGACTRSSWASRATRWISASPCPSTSRGGSTASTRAKTRRDRSRAWWCTSATPRSSRA